MGASILIVEDLFIEANDLRIILQKAGHTICGICKSVDQALSVLKKEKPDMVLLDIFLKGDLTGIHLAKILSGRNIPFIYLSANSNPSTLEAAKATRPHGFLVKPFREKDILVALEIADYRHKHTVELMQRQERWFSHLLINIINEVASKQQKLVLLSKAFQPIIPFDFIFIDTDIKGDSLQSLYGFRRVSLEEYEPVDWTKFLRKTRLSLADMLQQRKSNLWRREPLIRNGADFSAASFKDRVIDRIKQGYGVESGFYVPIVSRDMTAMTISFYSLVPDNFRQDQADLICPLRGLLATVLQSIRYQKKEDSLPESGVAVRPPSQIQGIIGRSPKLLQVLDLVSQVAAFDTTVLITGETGVGKEGLANAIHQLSGRKNRPLVKVNCAAIPDNLIESELFGHEKGAFTTALERMVGKFEQANGGTIFLDEIGEMPLLVQSKLLRVLQEKEIERIGGRSTVKIDVRIIAATNRNLAKEVTQGRFRMDLYYRINVFLLDLPPLRERKDDIPLLVDHFLEKYAEAADRPPKKFTEEALRQLSEYPWPGNIRELQHLVERHFLIARGDSISSVELPEPFDLPEPAKDEQPLLPVSGMDKAKIVAALKECNGKVSGKGGAAQLLGINPNTLTSRMKRLGISWQYILR